MTRVNVLEPWELTDNFLMAEYFELPRIYRLVRRRQLTGETLSQVKHFPSEYTYGQGHMTFFLDKLRWLYERHQELWNEGARRGISQDLRIDPNAQDFEISWFMGTEWWGGYNASAQEWAKARQKNWDRLQERMRYIGGVYQSG